MSLQINQNGAIGLPLADGPIVHSKHERGRSVRNGKTTQQPEHRVSADRHLYVFTLKSRRSASQFFGDGTEPAGLPARATRMGRCKIGKRLGKCFARTSRIGTE